MVEEENGDLNEIEDEGVSPSNYEDLVTEEPELEVDLEDYEAPRGVNDVEQDMSQLSDLKAVLKAISPKFENERVNQLTQPAMVSRIFPDNVLDKNKLIVLNLIEEDEDLGGDIPLIDYIMNVQDALSIGYEGRGIVERLEIAGVAHEEEMEKLAKDLGL